MFGYYVQLALQSFRRNKALTALMVAALALGIGACMTTLTVFYVLSGDPLPGRSQHLYAVQLDARSMRYYEPGKEPEDQLTRYDAETLLRARRADAQAMMTGGNVVVKPDRGDIAPFFAEARYTSADFFGIFGAPFVQGGAWDAAADDGHERVAVISMKLAQRLFDNGTALGRTIRLDDNDFRVIGVLADWELIPRFYDLNNRGYGSEDVFLPFTTSRDLKMSRSGNLTCWEPPTGDATDPVAPCVWIQYWVRLDSAAKETEYRRYLEAYSDAQRAAGRFERPTNIRLRNVMQWLESKQVVPGDVRLQVVVALSFLLVCLLNTAGLLLAKMLRRSTEVGVRRALGAPRRAIFMQCLVEAGAVGLAGGLLGLGLAWLGLWGVRHQPTPYAEFIHLDAPMLATTISLAIIASLFAGLLPAFRAMRVTPAVQLGTQ